MSQTNDWSIFEIAVTVIGALCGIIMTLGSVIWSMLNSRLKRVEGHTGRHFSNINDLQVDMATLETKVINHADKFEEIIQNTRRIEDKLDQIRSRK